MARGTNRNLILKRVETIDASAPRLTAQHLQMKRAEENLRPSPNLRCSASHSNYEIRRADGLNLGVLLQNFVAHFAAPAGLFISAEGQRRVEHVVAIDPHGSGAEQARDGVSLLDVARPHSRRETVNRIVCLAAISSTFWNGIAVTTGPKISSFTTFIFGLVFVSTVGFTK